MVEVVPIGKAKPDETVIAMAEDLLAKAKMGEVRSLMFIYETRDDLLVVQKTPFAHRFRLIGYLERAKHMILKGCDEDCHEL